LDAGAAALEGGLHGWLSDERRCGGDGLFLWLCGWRGVNIRGSRGRQWRLLEHDLEAWFVDGGLTMVPRCGVVVISGESPALRRQQRQHLWASCPSWGRCCGYLPAKAPGENP
jgi:hypothetical protein